jgi:predicted nucleic acid-binding protein
VKTYDAEYVALAKLHDCRLVTVDGRLTEGQTGSASS